MEGLSVCVSLHLRLWKVSPPLSVRQIAFYLPDAAKPQELLTLSEGGRMSEKLASLSIRFICPAAFIWTAQILSGACGGWDRQQRRDKPRSEEMTSQMEEWQFLRFQIIIPMSYSELWRIMGLSEERLTEAALLDRWDLELHGRGLFCFSSGDSLIAWVLSVYWLSLVSVFWSPKRHALSFLTFFPP